MKKRPKTIAKWTPADIENFIAFVVNQSYELKTVAAARNERLIAVEKEVQLLNSIRLAASKKPLSLWRRIAGLFRKKAKATIPNGVIANKPYFWYSTWINTKDGNSQP